METCWVHWKDRWFRQVGVINFGKFLVSGAKVWSFRGQRRKAGCWGWYLVTWKQGWGATWRDVEECEESESDAGLQVPMESDSVLRVFFPWGTCGFSKRLVVWFGFFGRAYLASTIAHSGRKRWLWPNSDHVTQFQPNVHLAFIPMQKCRGYTVHLI